MERLEWNSCTPVVDSCQYMAKPIQYCKVKKINLKKNNPQKIEKKRYQENISYKDGHNKGQKLYGLNRNRRY